MGNVFWGRGDPHMHGFRRAPPPRPSAVGGDKAHALKRLGPHSDPDWSGRPSCADSPKVMRARQCARGSAAPSALARAEPRCVRVTASRPVLHLQPTRRPAAGLINVGSGGSRGDIVGRGVPGACLGNTRAVCMRFVCSDA